MGCTHLMERLGSFMVIMSHMCVCVSLCMCVCVRVCVSVIVCEGVHLCRPIQKKISKILIQFKTGSCNRFALYLKIGGWMMPRCVINFSIALFISKQRFIQSCLRRVSPILRTIKIRSKFLWISFILWCFFWTRIHNRLGDWKISEWTIFHSSATICDNEDRENLRKTSGKWRNWPRRFKKKIPPDKTRSGLYWPEFYFFRLEA